VCGVAAFILLQILSAVTPTSCRKRLATARFSRKLTSSGVDEEGAEDTAEENEEDVEEDESTTAGEGPENDLLAEGNPFSEEEKETEGDENEGALLEESEEAEDEDTTDAEEVTEDGEAEGREETPAALMLKELDQDKDGKVNLKEFTEGYKVEDPEEHHKGRAQEIETAFAKNDKDKDNMLDVLELESADHDVLANQEQDLGSEPPSVA